MFRKFPSEEELEKIKRDIEQSVLARLRTYIISDASADRMAELIVNKVGNDRQGDLVAAVVRKINELQIKK